AAFRGLFLCLLVPALWIVESRRLRAISQTNLRASSHPPSTRLRAGLAGELSRDFADDPPIASRRPVIALALAGLAALALAMLVYYGQYVPVILERTGPDFFRARQP